MILEILGFIIFLVWTL